MPGTTLNEIEESLLTASIATMAKTISMDADTWIKVGKFLYKWLTERQPLSNHETDPNYQDFKRYTRMCALYQAKLGIAGIPVQWELDDKKCPTHESELYNNPEKFRMYCESLSQADYPMKTNLIRIVASIERLYQSIQSRSTLTRPLPYMKYRPDGYEAMFFSDLAQWLSVDLPMYSITSPETATLLKKRIEYCKEVQSTVFVFRADGEIHNPKERLDRIIKNLEVVHKDICKSIEAASFNNYIEEINRDLLDMTTNAFAICHLILNGVNQRELQVDEFLNPGIEDSKVIKLTRLLMGQWIVRTLNTAGIIANNFQSTIEFDLGVIETYLSTDFSEIDLGSTGLLPFATEQKEFAKAMLLKVINIHKAILNTYYVRASLVLAARVGVKSGENWLYGNDEGKAVVHALLIVIKDASSKLQEAINDFWDKFYINGYLPYALKKHVDDKNITYNHLNEANKRFNHIINLDAKIKRTVDTVDAHAKEFAGDSEITKQKKRILISNLFAYMERMPGLDPSILEFIKRMVVEQKTSSLAVQLNHKSYFIPQGIDPYIVLFPSAKMPIYLKAKGLLLDGELYTSDKFPLLKKPEKFYTRTQERLYHDFLLPYNNVLNTPQIFSIFYGISWYQFNDLREIYARTHQIMTEIYYPPNASKYTISLMPLPKIVDKNTLYIEWIDQVITYTVANNYGGISSGLIDIKTLDEAFELPITLEKLQPYMSKILGITSERDHTGIEPDEVPIDAEVDPVFFQLNKDIVTKKQFYKNTELELIDQCFKIALLDFSRKFGGSTFNMLTVADDFQTLKVKFISDTLEISIDPRLLTYAGGAFAIELEDYKRKLGCAEEQVATLEKAREEDQVIITQNKVVIAQNEAVIAQNKAVITQNEADLEKKDLELKHAQSDVLHLQEVCGSYKKQLESFGFFSSAPPPHPTMPAPKSSTGIPTV